jgi:transcription termination factor NusB
MSKFQEIPLNVSLDEWVDIAKDYCGEEAKKLINGVLNNYKNILIKEKIRIE